MRCTFLAGNYVLSCRADRVVYVPTLFEFQEYCKSKRFKICPIFVKAATAPQRPAKLLPPRILRIE